MSRIEESRFRKLKMGISKNREKEFDVFIDSELPTLNLSKSVDIETDEERNARIWFMKVMRNYKSIFKYYELDDITNTFSNLDNCKTVINNIKEDLSCFRISRDEDIEKMVIDDIKIMAIGPEAILM